MEGENEVRGGAGENVAFLFRCSGVAFRDGGCIAVEDLLWNFPSLVVGIGDLDPQAIFCFKAAFSVILSVVCFDQGSTNQENVVSNYSKNITMLENYIYSMIMYIHTHTHTHTGFMGS